MTRCACLSLVIVFTVASFGMAEPPRRPEPPRKASANKAAAPKAVPRAEEPAAESSDPLSTEMRLSQSDPYVQFCGKLEVSARLGAAWLGHMQRDDGLFIYGWIPALNRPLPDDHLLRQAGATAALAAAASQFQDADLAKAAQRALDVLTRNFTQADSSNSRIQRIVKSGDAHAVGLAALILLAICETEQADPATIELGEGLARFLATRQRADGSIATSMIDMEEPDSPALVAYYPGEALYAILRSYERRPEPWKLEFARRALPFYVRWWQEDPSAAFASWQIPAFTEYFLITQSAEARDFVLTMGDWLLALQYLDVTSVPEDWVGGFGNYAEGRIVGLPPGITTASFAAALVDAHRVAKAAEDPNRTRTYAMAAEYAFRFLMNTQFTLGNTSHFDARLAGNLKGAFFASIYDGTVRIDFNQHAVHGMVHYMKHVAAFRKGLAEAKQVPVIRPDAPRAN